MKKHIMFIVTLIVFSLILGACNDNSENVTNNQMEQESAGNIEQNNDNKDVVNNHDAIEWESVDGVSDEVYKELVQFYFFTVTMMDDFVDSSNADDAKLDTTWIVEHELYKEAEAYAKRNEDVVHPQEVFPNPLLFTYSKDPDQFSEKEQKYIEQMEQFIESFQRANLEDYEVLQKQLKEQLHIKDTYNPFNG